MGKSSLWWIWIRICCDTLCRAADTGILFLDTHTYVTYTRLYTWIHTTRMTESFHLSLSLAALFQVCLQVCVCVCVSVCFSTHICAHLQACMCLLCPISRHQVVTPSPTLGNTTVSFTIKAPFCLFDLFGYRLSLLYKSLLAFFRFSLCLFTPACRYFWRSFLKQRTMLNVEGITTSESFCFCFFKQKKTKKEKEVKVKKTTLGEVCLIYLVIYIGEEWNNPKGNPLS